MKRWYFRIEVRVGRTDKICNSVYNSEYFFTHRDCYDALIEFETRKYFKLLRRIESYNIVFQNDNGEITITNIYIEPKL